MLIDAFAGSLADKDHVLTTCLYRQFQILNKIAAVANDKTGLAVRRIFNSRFFKWPPVFDSLQSVRVQKQIDCLRLTVLEPSGHSGYSKKNNRHKAKSKSFHDCSPWNPIRDVRIIGSHNRSVKQSVDF